MDNSSFTKHSTAQMEAKDRFDACMKLVTYGTSRFDGRRQYEWKIRLPFWALLVAADAYLPRELFAWIVVPLSAVLYEFLFSRGMWVANENDKAFARHFVLEAQKILKHPDHVPTAPPAKVSGLRWWFGFLQDWSHQFQLVTTSFLVSLIYVLPQLGHLSGAQ